MVIKVLGLVLRSLLPLGAILLSAGLGLAQVVQQVIPQIDPPSEAPLGLPDVPKPLPPPEELLEPGRPVPEAPHPIPGEIPETITVGQFIVEGSTVFSAAELATVTGPYANKPLSFNELFAVRSAITELYAEAGYITSAAIIPPQILRNGEVVTIQVIEGQLEGIRVIGSKHLEADYVSKRIAQYADVPLNSKQILEGLQLLQLDPLIERVSAELSAGPRPGTSLLTLTVTEAETFKVNLTMDNGRSPTVGTFQHQLGVTQANLLGNGEQLNIGYSHTSGLDSLQVSYAYFLNPRNGTLELSAGFTKSHLEEAPFAVLDIESD